ncbi:MAG: phosphoribosyltransferase [Desulfurococcaceae archaeon]
MSIRGDVKLRYASWREIHRAILEISNKVMTSYKPEVLITICKGGLIPARIMVDLLGLKELGYIEVKFYKAVGVRDEKPLITFSAFPPLVAKNVLIIDDVVDSGRTMQVAVEAVSMHRPRCVKTAAIFVKPWSTFMPDYYYKITNEWIVFPWEICETMREGLGLEDIVEDREILKHCNHRNITDQTES